MSSPLPRVASFFARLKKTLGSGQPAGDAGARGEREAEEFLHRELGFVIIARNWRNPSDRREEIDLVGRDGDALVFVEVKSRAAHALVLGYHAVNSAKKTIMRRAIKAYLARLTTKPRTFRFDIVEVTLPAPLKKTTMPDARERKEISSGGKAEPLIRHYENVPLFPKFFHT